jgi:hypothetical protein
MKVQKLIITVLIVIGFSVSMISYTFFIKNITHQTTLETQEFNLDIDIKLGSVDLDPSSIYYLADKEVYAINLYDINEANYIDNLSISIIVDVSIASRLRFKLYESYELTRYYHNQEETVLKEIIYIDQQDEFSYPFSLMKKGMFTNYFKDEQDYMYVDQVITPEQTFVFNIIDGGNFYPIRENSLFHETCYLYLAFEFEVVQANRYQEIWNLETDPFNP